ncbi:MAG: benzoyl-CoA reductase, bzd-type, Q subunit, partial [Dehalococcoidia bacterium]|nr:benzoyl-CoA reductase, bzd-type, Q subunit [Dehalococcoidia bacterium]MBF8304321.1 benzoyl-CoA reductase, bzd-type, subunit [Dehalococcoidia bacterium]
MVEEKKEYWRWTEGYFLDKDIDWRKAKSITLGIDIGSVSTQAVIMTDGKIYCYA